MAASKAILLIVLLYLVKSFYCAEYHVKPNISSICPADAEFCLTLSEYEQNFTTYFTSGSTFTLLQGQHHLNETLNLSGVTNLTLRGDNTGITTIILHVGGSIIWKNSSECKINLLGMQYGGGKEIFHAVLTLEDSTALQILNVLFNGGALFSQSEGIRVVHSTVTFVNCSFTSWYSHSNDGAVYVNASNVTFSGTNSFTNNKAHGAINVHASNVTFSGINTFTHNEATLGGVIYMNASYVNFSGNSTLTHNEAFHGGAIYMNASYVNFSGIKTLTDNKAQYDGGAIYIDASCYVTFSDITTFTNNKVNASGGGIFAYNSKVTFSGNSAFLENYSRYRGAGLYSDQYSHITFTGLCIFQSNHASMGGGIYVRRSRVILKTGQRSAEFNFINNIAQGSGGALVAVENSNIECQESNINFINNFARTGKCGGVYIIDSIMKSLANITLKNNSAHKEGGGMYVQDSIIAITGNYSFLENKAKDGGGMVLETDVGRGTTVMLHSPVTMNFNGNRANRTGGGLLFINSNPCKVENGSCLFEIRQNIPHYTSQNVRLNFRDNFAGHAGSVVYGSFLQNCSTKVDNVVRNDSNFFEKYNILNISTVSHGKKVSRFSSDPIKLCFCASDNIDCNKYTTISVSPQVKFNLPVIALGQGSVPIPSTIHRQIKNSAGSTILHGHKIEEKCTNITFQLHVASNTTLLLSPYKDDKCAQYSQAEIRVKFECPAGFNLIGNHCECNEKLEKIIKCETNTLKIKRKGRSWIDIVDRNASSFVYYPECPLNYCNNDTSLDFSHSYDSNILCSPDRNGTLCGACIKGYSLTLNKFNCNNCDNSYISLLLLFALAGVAVIAVLLALHMTVAAGTINGLILYANIVNVNSLIFLRANETNILTLFISWLNLDLGIEICFYNGLNFYTYAWLEYVFPLYLWFLIGAIIISSRISAKVGMLFGSNPVAVLATVILMSYSKLFQATIVSLTPAILEYSDGRRHTIAWYYDANIQYFGKQHFSLGVTALCMILFLLPYTFLLMFSYRLQAFSRKKAFSWLNKIKPLLDAYYAPYRANTRYWPGLMLLVRGCLYTTFLLTSNRGNLIAISCVFTAVAFIPWLGHHIYEKFYNEILEASFILNICLLSAASYHVQGVGGKQETVTYLSISVAFLQFLGIVVFHLYLRLKNTKLFVLFRSHLVKKSLRHPKEVKEEKSIDVQEVSMTVMDLREPLLESQQQ